MKKVLWTVTHIRRTRSRNVKSAGMLVNVSYSDRKIQRQIDERVGPPFKLRERLALNGIGSPVLFIREASPEIRNLLLLDNNRDACNLELRPGGVILGFRSRLDSYALVIPYYKLSLLKGDIGVYTIHMDHHFIRVEADTRAVQKFFAKLLDQKAAFHAPGPQGDPI